VGGWVGGWWWWWWWGCRGARRGAGVWMQLGAQVAAARLIALIHMHACDSTQSCTHAAFAETTAPQLQRDAIFPFRPVGAAGVAAMTLHVRSRARACAFAHLLASPAQSPFPGSRVALCCVLLRRGGPVPRCVGIARWLACAVSGALAPPTLVHGPTPPCGVC